MELVSLFGLFAVAFAASALATGILFRALKDSSVIDHPNERSSHHVPTPRGGGLAVLVVIGGVWFLSSLMLEAFPPVNVAVALVVLAVVAIFWFEDARGLPLVLRLIVQGVAAALILLTMGVGRVEETVFIFQGWFPPAVDFILSWGLLVWFANLYNFMDGIDGISVAETVTIGLGSAVIGVLTVGGEDVVVPGMIAAGAMVGFFVWNRPPARIFLGDVGSVPIGLLLGWVLLDLAGRGLWAPALILPLYYLADATVTLFRRAVRGEKIWHAHRDHFYQLAVRRGLTHGAVAAMVFVMGVVLAGLAVAALWQPVVALPAAALLTGLFLRILRGKEGA